MRDTFKPGVTFELTYEVPSTRTVPHLLPESEEFRQMPEVLATGYMVGLVEWACIQAVNPHLDWPREQTVGTHVDLSHTAATPPGMKVTIAVEVVEVDGRRLVFEVVARDDKETISKGRHERFVIDAERFNRRVTEKAAGR